VENLAHAAQRFSHADLRLLIEPINTRDRPGFYLSRSTQAMDVIDAVGADNLFLQFDVYHTQVMQGDIVKTFEAHRGRIRHVQIADNPGRHEPGTGELNFPFILAALDEMAYEGWVSCEYALLAALDEMAYEGWVSCEYAPSTTTEESLHWARGYLAQS
jgi:hydroxypyruvate isomerase